MTPRGGAVRVWSGFTKPPTLHTKLDRALTWLIEWMITEVRDSGRGHRTRSPVLCARHRRACERDPSTRTHAERAKGTCVCVCVCVCVYGYVRVCVVCARVLCPPSPVRTGLIESVTHCGGCCRRCALAGT